MIPPMDIKRKLPGILSAVSAVGLALALAAHKIRTVDLPWHLRTGEWILGNRTVPHIDMFNFINEGRQWIDAQWLFQIACHLVDSLAGDVGLTLLCMFLSALIILPVLLFPSKRFGLPLKSLFACMLLLAVNTRINLRPELLTCFYMGAMFLTLEKSKKDARWLFIVPVIQVLWVNSQGLWPIGVAVTGAYLLDSVVENFRSGQYRVGGALQPAIFIVLAVVLLTGFLQPYGLDGFLFPLMLFKEVTLETTLHKQMIHEFQPLLSGPFLPGAVLPFLFLSLCSVISAIVCGKKLRPGISLLAIIMFFMAINARRNVSVAGIAMVFLLIVHLDIILGSRNPTDRSGFRITASVLSTAAAAVFILLSLIPAERKWDGSLREPGFGFSHQWYAEETGSFLNEIGYKGRIINNVDMGGYLIYWGWPDWKVFSDSRMEIGTEEMMALHHAVFTDYLAFREVSDKYAVAAVVVRHREPYLADFAARLSIRPDWVGVHADKMAIVFLKRGAGYDHVIAERRMSRTEVMESVME